MDYNQITNMVIEFNKEYLNECIFYIVPEVSETTGLTRGIIKPLKNMMFIEKAILILTDEFYEKLEKFFGEKGFMVRYNNTRDVFWLAQ